MIWSPAALTLARLRAAGMHSMPQDGIESVTAPGAVAAWAQLSARYGRKPWTDVLAPAIHLADEGFPVPELIAAEWAGSDAHLRTDPESARVYLPGGRPPRNPRSTSAARFR